MIVGDIEGVMLGVELMDCVRDAESDCDTEVESEPVSDEECVCDTELETEVDRVVLIDTVEDRDSDPDIEAESETLFDLDTVISTVVVRVVDWLRDVVQLSVSSEDRVTLCVSDTDNEGIVVQDSLKMGVTDAVEFKEPVVVMPGVRVLVASSVIVTLWSTEIVRDGDNDLD